MHKMKEQVKGNPGGLQGGGDIVAMFKCEEEVGRQ